MHQSTTMPMCVAHVGAHMMSIQMWRCVFAGSATMGCVATGAWSIPVEIEPRKNCSTGAGAVFGLGFEQQR